MMSVDIMPPQTQLKSERVGEGHNAGVPSNGVGGPGRFPADIVPVNSVCSALVAILAHLR
jgi:hypothetical protein